MAGNRASGLERSFDELNHFNASLIIPGGAINRTYYNLLPEGIAPGVVVSGNCVPGNNLVVLGSGRNETGYTGRVYYFPANNPTLIQFKTLPKETAGGATITIPSSGSFLTFMMGGKLRDDTPVDDINYFVHGFEELGTKPLKLSQKRYSLASAIVGRYVLAIGGLSNGTYSTVVDIINADSLTMFTINLTFPRANLAAAACEFRFVVFVFPHSDDICIVLDPTSMWQVEKMHQGLTGLTPILSK